MIRILVVDDEADVQLLFDQRFRREIRDGVLAFTFACSGEQAVAYLEQAPHHSEVVLILSDITMPGMSGLELLRRIRLGHPNPSPQVMMLSLQPMATATGRACSWVPTIS